MRKAQKKQAEDFAELLGQAQDEIKRAMKRNHFELAMQLLAQCQEGAEELRILIEVTEGKDFKTVQLLQKYEEEVSKISQRIMQNPSVQKDPIYQKLYYLQSQIKSSIKNDIKVRLEVVFLPYKASMWDSLESIWKAADADPDCDAYVIPIPYFDKNPDGSFREKHYEGGQYPDYVPVTKYDEFDFEAHHPDAIYIHNGYDDCNFVTSIHPFFYSKNLKKFTDCLVYIPYFVLAEPDPENDAVVENISHFCMIPGVFNADRVIVQSEAMKKVYVRALMKTTDDNSNAIRKYWDSKIEGTGFPKFDKVINTKKEDLEIPEEWLRVIEKPDGSWKKIVLYNTGVNALLQHSEKMLKKMESVFEIFGEYKDEIALLWRPHPLIQATITSMRSQLWGEYKKIRDRYIEQGWGIYDDSSDLDRAIVLSDAYYGNNSSVVHLCQARGILLMLQDVDA